MLILGLDFEATDVDTKTARITEIGAILFDTDTKTFWNPILSVCVYAKDYPALSPEVQEVTGLKDEILQKCGFPPMEAFKQLNTLMSACTHVVAHNGKAYDKPLYLNEVQRAGLTPVEKPWLDTMLDINYPKSMSSRKLDHLVSDHNIPWSRELSHRAVFDVAKMLLLLKQYDFEKILARSQEPDLVYRALTRGPWEDNGVSNAMAKECGFRWQEAGGKVYSKQWVKLLKKSSEAELIEKALKLGLKIKLLEERIPE